MDSCGTACKDSKTLHLVLARGAPLGQRHVLEGEGDASVDTLPGDLILVLQQKPHGRFTRSGVCRNAWYFTHAPETAISLEGDLGERGGSKGSASSSFFGFRMQSTGVTAADVFKPLLGLTCACNADAGAGPTTCLNASMLHGRWLILQGKTGGGVEGGGRKDSEGGVGDNCKAAGRSRVHEAGVKTQILAPPCLHTCNLTKYQRPAVKGLPHHACSL